MMKERRITRARDGVPFETSALLAPEQALTAYFSRAALRPPQVETVELGAAFGRILAAPVKSDADYPDAPRSTMDGFALRSQETPGTLRIAGEIAAGQGHGPPLERGSALRIATGGMLPTGADSVVPFENVEEQGGVIAVPNSIPPGDCIHPAGADMRAGEILLASGRRIGAPELGVLATLGHTSVCVYRRPVFAVFSSGDELVDAHATPAPGQIRDSNRWAIAGALAAMGTEVRHLATAPDDPALLRRRVLEGLASADGVVMSGGSSVGRRDLTPEIVAELGRPGVIVHGLRVKPGKPTLLASIEGKPVIGLPGNPASALTILEAVAAPIVGALVGAPVRAETVEAVIATPLQKRPGWTWYVPMRLERSGTAIRAHPLPIRSANVSLPARASGYVELGESVESLAAGDAVLVRRFLKGGAP